MAFIPVENVVELNLNYRWLGSLMQNTLHYRYAAQPTITQLNTLATYIVDWWNTNIKPQVSNVCILDNVYLRDLTVAAGVELTAAIGATGARTGDSLPGNVTLVASFRTGFAGRSYRGRNYLVGMTEGDVSGNQVTTAYQAAILAAYGKLVNGSTPTPPATFGIVSYRTGGAPRTAGLFTPVTNVLVNVDVDSQRRRLAGRGR